VSESARPRRARAHRRWRLIAIVSIAMNLFLAGLMAGGFLRKGRGDRPQLAARAFSMKGAGRALGPEVRPVVDEIREARQGERRAYFERLRTAANEATSALSAEPFDSKRLDAALAELRNAHVALQEQSHAGFRQLAERLTPAQRAALAEANARFGRRGGRGVPKHGRPRRR